MSESNKPETPASAVADPSMEDILASIRRILSEDEQQPAAGPSLAAADDDVLVLDSSMLRSEPLAPVAPPSPPAATAPEAAPEPPAVDWPKAADPEAAEPGTAAGLVAPEAAAAAAASIGSLLRTIASDRALQVRTGGLTIEDIVRQMLRPLVKEWLDANLPGLVERLVRAEIERVVNREIP